MHCRRLPRAFALAVRGWWPGLFLAFLSCELALLHVCAALEQRLLGVYPDAFSWLGRTVFALGAPCLEGCGPIAGVGTVHGVPLHHGVIVLSSSVAEFVRPVVGWTLHALRLAQNPGRKRR